MTDSMPTRRELRDRERAIQARIESEQFLNQQPAVVVPPAPATATPVIPVAEVAPVAPVLPTKPSFEAPEPPRQHGRRAAQIPSEPALEPALPILPPTPTYTQSVEPVQVPSILQPEPAAYRPEPVAQVPMVTAEGALPVLPVAREIETNTNSIVIDTVPTLTNSTIVVTIGEEQTRMIRTGAIELPPLSSITGEVEIVSAAKQADMQLKAAATGSIPVTIEPQPARKFVARKRERVFPTKLKRGMAPMHTVLATGIIMATVGTVFLTAFMLKLI